MSLIRQSFNCFRHSITHTAYGNTTVCNLKRWVSPTLKELEKRKKRVGPLPPKPRRTYLEWNDDAEIYSFSKRLGENFNNDMLKRAFLHPSYRIQQEFNGKDDDLQDNKHFVYKGDKIIREYIREKFAKTYHKDLVEAAVNYLTSNEMLGHVAFHMGVKELIYSSEYPPEVFTLANTFKAIVSVLKDSTSQENTEKFIDDFLVCQLHDKDVYEVWDIKNPYEYFQNLAVEKGYKDIEPRICNQSATNTILANYQIGLYSNKKLLATGWGESIEVAKDMAAVNAIKILHNTT